MKRSWNAYVWVGFAVTLLAPLSYFLVFLRFPATRDVPWVNLLLFVVAGWFLGIGLKRAFGEPERYRGKVSGVVLGAVSLLLFGLFCYFTFSLSRDLPASSDAPRAGQQSPGFTLADANGKLVSLSQLLKGHRAALLIFYRGYW
jgi:hypothetical protein